MSLHAWVARIGLLVLLGAVAWAGEKDVDHEKVKSMPLAEQVRDCLACHASEKDKGKLVSPAHSCDAHCLRCHKDMQKHHPVGPEVEQNDKVPLPLLAKNKVACISCHDLKTAQTDTSSWKSQSLYARLFQRQPLYQTYYLRINNSDGKLCKACH